MLCCCRYHIHLSHSLMARLLWTPLCVMVKILLCAVQAGNGGRAAWHGHPQRDAGRVQLEYEHLSAKDDCEGVCRGRPYRTESWANTETGVWH